MRINFGEKKTLCPQCGLWASAGKKCIWCGAELPLKHFIKVRCSKCLKITYVERMHLYDKNRCVWCNADITVVK
jgi:methionyl-tRNA synthetase